MEIDIKRKSSRNGLYDFLKGISIISVLLLHVSTEPFLRDSIANAHIWQAVPMFLLVSFLLNFKFIKDSGGGYYSKSKIFKIIKRIIIPFIVAEISIGWLCAYFQQESFIFSLNRGPGSYYPYIYIQLWVISPFLYRVLQHNFGMIWITVLCILSTIFISSFFLSDTLYRLLAVRYLFLSVIAYYLLRDYSYPYLEIILGLGSLVFMVFSPYTDFTPIIDERWDDQQWPAYFYTLIYYRMLNLIYAKFDNKITKFFKWCGINSYWIFLLQMTFLSVFSLSYIPIDNITIQYGIYIILLFFFSLVPVYTCCKINTHIKQYFRH